MKKILVALDLFLPKIANWGKIHFQLDPKEKEIYKEQVLKEMPDFNEAKKVVKVSFSPNLDYAGAIVDYAKRNDYDLIVIGSHGRTGIRKVVLGSVAERVISRSLIPVLTINIAHPGI